MSDATLPSAELLRQQAEWLAPARSRLLRRALVARCRRVLDLGCGPGVVTEELARRSAGIVVALDRSRAALTQLSATAARLPDQETIRPSAPVQQSSRGLPPTAVNDTRSTAYGLRPTDYRLLTTDYSRLLPVEADAARLPFASRSFDMVFCQFTLLWLGDAAVAVGEIHRVLARGGRLVAIEPDYAGMIENPPEIATREFWLSGIARAGGDPAVGRKLPGTLARAGFQVRVDLLDRLEPPSPGRFALVEGLPLAPVERQALSVAQAEDRRLAATESAGNPQARVAHLPVFLVTATKPS